MRSGETAHLDVQSLTLDGEGVGRVGDHELRCRGAFPGERADVRIVAVSRHHPRAHARLVAVAQPHPARRKPPCPNQERREGRCTGCPIMDLDEAAQRDVKRTMLASFGLEVARVEPAPRALGYRFSSKRVVGTRRGRLQLGSYAFGTHDFAPMPGCLVDHPRLVRAFDRVEEGARALGIAPYDEATGEGDLRYVWAKTNGDEVIVTLVSAREHGHTRALADWLEDTAAGVLESVQPSRGNALRGGPARLLRGKPELTLSLLDQPLEVGALGFVQPNPAVAAACYEALTTLADGAPRTLAFDLYAGAGVTTRLLARTFGEVVPCEAHPESARALGGEAESVEAFLGRTLALPSRRTPDLVIANPPRKGLGTAVCASLRALAAPALHVMSCGPEGLARDLAALSDRYEVRSLEAFDTLPQTPHVELVAKLALRG